MDIFASSQSFAYWVCALVVCSDATPRIVTKDDSAAVPISLQEASTDVSETCVRPPYSPDLLQFFQIDGLWVELNDTGQNHLPSCHDVSEIISVKPAYRHRLVDVTGSLTIILPPLSSHLRVQVTCQVQASGDASLLFYHIRNEEGRVFVGQERGDSAFNKEYLTLTPPRVNDSGLFICQDRVTGNSHDLEIRFYDSSSPTSRPTFVFPKLRHTYKRELGGKLTLRCNVTDSTEVWWKHKTWSREIIVADTLLLNLDNISLSDQGSYLCVAKGFGGQIVESKSQTLIIPVSSSPTSRPTFVFPKLRHTYKRELGGKLTLRCNVTDSIEVWWKHKTWSRETIVADTLLLNLDNISLSDQGSYLCVAKGFGGQIVESKSQTLIIPDSAQVLLTIFRNYQAQSVADNASDTFIQHFRNAKFDVFSFNNEINEGLSFHLGKWLTSENSYNAILEEIGGIVREYAGNLSHVQNIDFWMQGLSFCIEESDYTAAGTLTFPSTIINSKADCHEHCIALPNGPRGSRKCDGDLVNPATWKESVVHNCFKTSATNITDSEHVLVQQFFKDVEEAEVTSNNVSFISRDLADITSFDIVSKEDIGNVTNILEKVAQVNSSSPTVTNNVLETIDNIVTTATRIKGNVLESEASSSIIKSLENQLETVKMGGSNFSSNRPNIAVEVVQLQNIEASVTFASLESENNNISETKLSQGRIPLDQGRLQASIQIPKPILQLSSKCIFANNSGQESFPFTFTIHRSGALFHDPQYAEHNLKQNTWVTSASILCEVSSLPEGSHITTWFFPTMHPKLKRKGKCVFWDHDLYGNRVGGWSSKKCLDPVIGESGIYKCSCGHMPKFANFAVLMDLKGNINNKALHILTITGCVSSIVGLMVTIVSYISIKKFRIAQPKQIVLNLCVALLGLYSCFLIGINRTEHQLVCVIFGGLIHFFCLSTMAWMSVEATQLYLLLVKVIGVHVENFLRKCSLIAWGLPFLVVAICVVLTKEDYAHEYCFPESTTYVFSIGVLGLVAVMLAYNAFMYTAIIWNLSVTSKYISQSQANRNRVLPRLKNAFAISVLLGLSWLFGFLAIGSLRMTFNILFCLFNSFQGFLIFLLFCARQEEVRAVWGKWLGITIPQSMTDRNISTSEKPTTSTAQRWTSYASNTRKVDG